MAWTERILHGSLDEAALEFAGKRTGGQSQRPVQGKDAGYARLGIAHAGEFNSSKDGGKQAGAQPLRVSHLAVLLPEVQRRSHISVATLPQARLQNQTLHLPAFGLLLTFDLLERALKCAAGGEPGLETSELKTGRRGAAGERGCCCHILTVLPQDYAAFPNSGPAPRTEYPDRTPPAALPTQTGLDQLP